jgi:hypothetical protein
LDLKIFALLANAYRRGIQNRCYLGATYSIDKITFLEVFQEAREKAITKENIKSAWAATGLNPFNPAIVLDKLLSNQKPLQLPASPIIKAKDSILLPFIPKIILQIEALIYQVIENNNLDTKEVLAKIGKAAYSVLADVFIQRSTNAELVAATKSKYQKCTRQHYSQARVMNIEVVKEREAKAAEKAIEITWQDLAKITPNLFEELFTKSPIKPRVLGYRNTQVFTTAVKPLLQLSPSLFLDRKAPVPNMIMSQQLSQPQATLVVVRWHCTRRDNSDRIGRPKDKNLKLRKKEREVRASGSYL